MENPNPNPNPAIRVATAGEALIDLISQPDGRLDPCLGGAVFNLTRAIARQGLGRRCGPRPGGFFIWRKHPCLPPWARPLLI